MIGLVHVFLSAIRAGFIQRYFGIQGLGSIGVDHDAFIIMHAEVGAFEGLICFRADKYKIHRDFTLNKQTVTEKLV